MLVEPEAGTLVSAVAERAGRLGRPVFAVPGPVTTPGRDMARRRHHGEAIGAVRLFGEWAPIERDEPTPYEYAHQLVRDGAARLVRDAEDVLADPTSAGGAR